MFQSPMLPYPTHEHANRKTPINMLGVCVKRTLGGFVPCGWVVGGSERARFAHKDILWLRKITFIDYR